MNLNICELGCGADLLGCDRIRIVRDPLRRIQQKRAVGRVGLDPDVFEDLPSKIQDLATVAISAGGARVDHERTSLRAAALFRRGCTNMSRISPSLSTARHSHRRLPPITTAISSRCPVETDAAEADADCGEHGTFRTQRRTLS